VIAVALINVLIEFVMSKLLFDAEGAPDKLSPLGPNTPGANLA
jgi:hypothetical protein